MAGVHVTVIPGRGGSKGVPRKNLKLLGGLPLICHSVHAALGASEAGQVIVSSDSDEILAAARVSERVLCVKRPAELASDQAGIIPVYRHAVAEYERQTGKQVEVMIGLEPTTPFRTPADIDGSVARFRDQGADVVVSVKETAENPYFVQVEARAEDARWFSQVKKSKALRRQDAPKVYTLNGAVYVYTRAALFALDNLYAAAKFGVYEMPSERSIDLDNELDFEIAEVLIRRGVVKVQDGK